MALRGFDEYDITLGDEMRGERASRNKTLDAAEADLCIRANLIAAIENCDLTAFPNQSVVAGYVRSYARYLGMNPEHCYLRFCAESGFRSPVAVLVTGGAKPAPGAPKAAAPTSQAAMALAQSRFAAPPTPHRIRARISWGGLASSIALIGLVIGLSYGGYALLQDIQRVGFAPLPEAPSVVADAPLIRAPQIDAGLIDRPDASAYQADGVLAAMSIEAELLPPVLPSRDGPISAINPATSGVFMGLAEPEDPRSPHPDAEIQADPLAAADPVPAAGDEPLAPAPGVSVHAAGEAWVRVQDGDQAVLFEGILAAGQQFALPPLATAPMLRTGNAGAIYVVIDGAPYGPIGGRGRVVKNVSLLAQDVRSTIPEANLSATTGVVDTADQPQRRASIDAPR